MKNKIFKRILIILGGILAFILVAVIITAVVTAVFMYNAEADYGKYSPEAIEVSVIDLANNPEKYHGKLVRVRGVFSCDIENDAIYADFLCYGKSTSDSRPFMPADLNSSVWLVLREFELKNNLKNMNISMAQLCNYSGKYVTIEGVFDKYFTGAWGAFPGGIKDISRLSIEKGRKIFYFERMSWRWSILFENWAAYYFSPIVLWHILV